MRHRHGLRKLNRTSSHRLAMLRNMSVSLLRHEAIRTTLPKAKELRRVVEPIITLGKKDTLANKRLAFNRLRDREMVVKLFAELGPRYANRNGGYLRILKIGNRVGDNALRKGLRGHPINGCKGFHQGNGGVDGRFILKNQSGCRIFRCAFKTQNDPGPGFLLRPGAFLHR